MTILNTTTQPTMILALWIPMIVLGLIAGISFWSEDMIKTAWLMAAIGVVGILGCIFWTPIETRYECLFEAGTTYTEVAQNWNVVEQRGDIWVVTAKDGTRVPVD